MSSTDNLSRPFAVRLPSEKAVEYEQLSRDSGESMSVVLRKVLTEASPVFYSRVPVSAQEDRIKALHYLSKSSNNINQVAKHLNILNLQDRLTYQECAHYLRVLDTIAAGFTRALRIFDVN